MRVSFLDLRSVNARFASEYRQALDEVLASGRVLYGEQSMQFADEFATWNESPFCVPLANGLDALRLTLEAWLSLGRLQLGDEVIVPANSFVASALAVSESGLELVLADVDPETSCLSAATVAAALTPRTRVVMPVHLYGQVCSMDAIRALCAQNGILILEDAAQAHGASDRGIRAGNFGEAGAFSFYPSKNLGALGDAGCMVTRDRALADRVRSLGSYGSSEKYRHDYRGSNSRIDELQAAFLRIKLRALDRDNNVRRAIASRYTTAIEHPMIMLPHRPTDPAAHVWHLFVVRTAYRENLIAHLADHEIETMIHYPCAIHRQLAYRDAFDRVILPAAERLQDEVLSLPMSPVMTDDEVSHVISTINEWRPHSHSVPAAR